MSQKNKAVEQEDISQLRRPIQISGKPVEQIVNCVHYGSPELRCILMDEVDIILECKVCRALFRDIPNLIAHKRNYCTKSAVDDKHVQIADLPEEKVVVIQPQAPEETVDLAETTRRKSNVPRCRKSKLEETIQRIQSGERGRSQAFKIYSQAADTLQRQRETMRVATIRTTPIQTNRNAVFMDVNVASVNIHERQTQSQGGGSAAGSSSSREASGNSPVITTRKAGEAANNRPTRSSRKPEEVVKHSGELQKMLMQQLKDIQMEKLQKTQRRKDSKPVKSSPPISESSKRRPGGGSTRGASVPSDESNKAKAAVRPVADGQDESEPSVESGKDRRGAREHFMSMLAEVEEHHLVRRGSPEDEAKSSFPRRQQEAHQTSRDRRRKPLFTAKAIAIAKSRRAKEKQKAHVKERGEEEKTWYPCPHCSSAYSYFLGLTRHLIREHGMTKTDIDRVRTDLRKAGYRKAAATLGGPDSETFTCSRCSKAFCSKRDMHSHMKQHDGDDKTLFPCPYCPKVFLHFFTMTRHLRSHHNKTKQQTLNIRDTLYKEGYSTIASPTSAPAVKLGTASRPSSSASLQTNPQGKEGEEAMSVDVKREIKASNDSASSSSKQDTDTEKKVKAKTESTSKAVETLASPQTPVSGSQNEKSNTSKVAGSSSGAGAAHGSDRNPPRSKTPAGVERTPGSPDAKHPPVYACRKCRLTFGRRIRYENHIKVCKGRDSMRRRSLGSPVSRASPRSSDIRLGQKRESESSQRDRVRPRKSAQPEHSPVKVKEERERSVSGSNERGRSRRESVSSDSSTRTPKTSSSDHPVVVVVVNGGSSERLRRVSHTSHRFVSRMRKGDPEDFGDVRAEKGEKASEAAGSAARSVGVEVRDSSSEGRPASPYKLRDSSAESTERMPRAQRTVQSKYAKPAIATPAQDASNVTDRSSKSTAIDKSKTTAIDISKSTAIDKSKTTAIDISKSTAVDKAKFNVLDKSLMSDAIDKSSKSNALDKSSKSDAIDKSKSTAVDKSKSDAVDTSKSNALEKSSLSTAIDTPKSTAIDKSSKSTAIDKSSKSTAIDKTSSDAIEKSKSTAVDKLKFSVTEKSKSTPTKNKEEKPSVVSSARPSEPASSSSPMSKLDESALSESSPLLLARAKLSFAVNKAVTGLEIKKEQISGEQTESKKLPGVKKEQISGEQTESKKSPGDEESVPEVKTPVQSSVSLEGKSVNRLKAAGAPCEKKKQPEEVEKEEVPRILKEKPREHSSPGDSLKNVVPALSERPKRKRKVPSRNLDAEDLLLKIHDSDRTREPQAKRARTSPSSAVVAEDKSSSEEKKRRQRRDLRRIHSPNSTSSRDNQSDGEEEESSAGKLRSQRIYVLSGEASSSTKGQKLQCYNQTHVDKLVDEENLTCRECGEKSTQIFNLRRHIIRVHLKWSRYKCKLCKYKSFDRSECTTHILRTHKNSSAYRNVKSLNALITDLAKQGSAARSRKKLKTLQDKQIEESAAGNIYARPNVRRVPRLADRATRKKAAEDGPSESTSLSDSSNNSDKTSSSSSANSSSTAGSSSCSSDSNEAMDIPNKTNDDVIIKTQENNCVDADSVEVFFQQSGRSSVSSSPKAGTGAAKEGVVRAGRRNLPFNISTRNSPRTFDISPYSSGDVKTESMQHATSEQQHATSEQQHGKSEQQHATSEQQHGKSEQQQHGKSERQHATSEQQHGKSDAVFMDKESPTVPSKKSSVVESKVRPRAPPQSDGDSETRDRNIFEQLSSVTSQNSQTLKTSGDSAVMTSASESSLVIPMDTSQKSTQRRENVSVDGEVVNKRHIIIRNKSNCSVDEARKKPKLSEDEAVPMDQSGAAVDKSLKLQEDCPSNSKEQSRMREKCKPNPMVVVLQMTDILDRSLPLQLTDGKLGKDTPPGMASQAGRDKKRESKPTTSPGVAGDLVLRKERDPVLSESSVGSRDGSNAKQQSRDGANAKQQSRDSANAKQSPGPGGKSVWSPLKKKSSLPEESVAIRTSNDGSEKSSKTRDASNSNPPQAAVSAVSSTNVTTVRSSQKGQAASITTITSTSEGSLKSQPLNPSATTTTTTTTTGSLIEVPSSLTSLTTPRVVIFSRPAHDVEPMVSSRTSTKTLALVSPGPSSSSSSSSSDPKSSSPSGPAVSAALAAHAAHSRQDKDDKDKCAANSSNYFYEQHFI